MKIVLTGGGTGGHFYPLIAVAQQIRAIAAERKLLDPQLIYIGPDPFDKQALAELNIEFRPSPAGKRRRYRSILNFLDIFKTAWGVVRSTFQLFSIYPDVVFSKGGYASVPTVFAARLLRIPVIIHESDAHPGRANEWAAKFARYIGIAHESAAEHFPQKVHDKIALVGNPIREQLEHISADGATEFLHIDPSVPTILVLGGSMGSETINDAILDALPLLVDKYNIIHQTGKDHLESVRGVARLKLQGTPHESHFRAFGLLNALALRMAGGVSSLVISRAGSGTIFELASWGKPAIIVPIPEEVSHDQTRNAFSYARSGAAVVIQQKNLTPHLLLSEIDRIMTNSDVQQAMSAAAAEFARPDAAEKMATIIVETALEHEA